MSELDKERLCLNLKFSHLVGLHNVNTFARSNLKILGV